MAQFIDPRVWDDQTFLSLEDGARILYLHLLFGPGRDIPGLFRETITNLGECLQRPIHEIERSMKVLEAHELTIVDRKRRVVCVPKAPDYAVPPNNNQLKRWYMLWRDIPACDQKIAHVPRLKLAVNLGNERVAKMWRSSFGRVLTGEITNTSNFADMTLPDNVVQLFDHKADGKTAQTEPRAKTSSSTDQTLDPNRDVIPE